MSIRKGQGEGAQKGKDITILRVATEKLLLAAGLFWAFAGVSILAIGVHAFALEPFTFWIPLATIAVFSFFYFMIFRRMVKRNSRRIMSFEDARTSLLRFMDMRGYIIMIFMMTLGAGLRASGLVPHWFFAFFYTGLGAALLLAGFSSFYRYLKRKPVAS